MSVHLTLELGNGPVMILDEVGRNFGHICVATVNGLCVR